MCHGLFLCSNTVTEDGDEGGRRLRAARPRHARAYERLRVTQMESSRSIAASSSAEPWTFGPLNHLRAETAYQMPAQPMTTSTAIGV